MRRGGLFWGIVLVLVGVIFLFDNLGVFDSLAINVWGIVFPAILLLAGIWLVAGVILKRNSYMENTFSIPAADYDDATFEIEFQFGELSISLGSNPQMLLEGEFEGGVITNKRLVASGLHASLAFPNGQRAANAGSQHPTWAIRLGSQIPIQLDITTGAVKANLDLRGLSITNFNFESGASGLQIYFPEKNELVQAKIKGGATSIDIHIPSNVSARIITESGLSTFNIDERRFLSSDNIYESVDFDTADQKLELILELGLSTVTIS